ncbi:hypothetical protein [Photobacterium swingsii]|uniref:hypothetical protein n=1 Tax=Photobacterium swingsii TaxID=680026 RepID=UPI00406906D5
MTLFLKTSIAAVLSATLLTGCVNPDQNDPNAATKQGAIGGALLGLTMGALTGDAELAAKGAIAGGVAGGVSGSMVDLDNNRDNQRHSSRDDAIAQIGNSQQQGANAAPSPTQPQTWAELDKFTGKWQVAIWSNTTGETINAKADAAGSLTKTTTAQIAIDNLQVNGSANSLAMTAEFSFTPESGYILSVKNNVDNSTAQFVGEYQAANIRYNFYPESTDVSVIKGVDASQVRLELGFAGNNVWMVDTWAAIDGQDVKVQSYRFTRS